MLVLFLSLSLLSLSPTPPFLSLPNQTLKENPISQIPQKLQNKFEILMGSPMEAKRRTVRTLVTKLSSVVEKTRVDSLCELRLMTKQDPEIRPLISDSDAIPYLAETLYSSSHDSQENAAATLLNLSISCKESLVSTRGVLDAISHILSHHRSTSSPSAVQSAAATLHSLLVVDDYRPIIGSKRDIVYALVDIVKTMNSPTRSVKDALKALFGISLYPLNRGTMIHLGAISSLFTRILKDGRVGIVEDSTAVIAQIAGCEESEEAFRKVSGIGVLVDLLDSVTGSSMRTKENAVSGLLNLVRCGGDKVAIDVRERAIGAIDGITDVGENGSAKGKSKAMALLKVLLDGGSSISNNGGCNTALRDNTHTRFDNSLQSQT